MAKRFTDSNKWADEWFSDLEPDMKLVWLFLLDNCDHAGIWKRNIKLLKYSCGTVREQLEIQEILNDRIFIFEDKWFIPKYLKFQYSSGIGNNMPALVSVRKQLERYNLIERVIEQFGNSFVTIKDKDKDKGKEMDKEKEIRNYNFSEILKIYSNKTYESQSQGIKDKFTKVQYDSYVWFLNLFKNYKAQLASRPFPLMNQYYEEIFSKFKKEEIESGAKKLQSLGINANADFVCRFVDCIGYATKNNSSSVNSTDLNALNEMGKFQNIKPHLKGDQSFKPKNP